MKRRTLIILGVLFATAVVAAVYLHWHGRPQAEGKNPLSGVESSDIVRILLSNENGTTELVRGPDRWELEAPVKDWAEPEMVDTVLNTLREFAVGAVVSENPTRYDQFEIGDGTGTHVQVFVKGKEKPALDSYVGKNVSGVQTAYFRYAGKTPVHLARNIASWALSRDALSFRFARAMPVLSSRAISIGLKGPAVDVELIRSSETWLRAGSDQVPSSEEVGELLQMIQALYAVDFLANDQYLAMAGLEGPYLTIRVKNEGEQFVLRIGRMLAGGTSNEVARFARLEGRETLFTLRGADIDAIVGLAKTIVGAKD